MWRASTNSALGKYMREIARTGLEKDGLPLISVGNAKRRAKGLRNGKEHDLRMVRQRR